LDQELVTYLMAGAHAYLQPSLEEGAGLAAMEAATYGCSVLSSTRGGSREHLGPSAVYVEPTKVDSIRHGLTQVWKSDRDGTVGQYVVRHRSSEQLPAQLDALYRRLLT
jgi:glycosyltransferase involved in cell wall biosynthesis